mmetsp:Transcript_33534/g.78569  ORF Transcript_33534/g.78569 Transcript_33534/m.78569 type:complete len:214 (-) Transcript_33534:251-892(-)
MKNMSGRGMVVRFCFFTMEAMARSDSAVVEDSKNDASFHKKTSTGKSCIVCLSRSSACALPSPRPGVSITISPSLRTGLSNRASMDHDANSLRSCCLRSTAASRMSVGVDSPDWLIARSTASCPGRSSLGRSCHSMGTRPSHSRRESRIFLSSTDKWLNSQYCSPPLLLERSTTREVALPAVENTNRDACRKALMNMLFPESLGPQSTTLMSS